MKRTVDTACPNFPISIYLILHTFTVENSKDHSDVRKFSLLLYKACWEKRKKKRALCLIWLQRYSGVNILENARVKMWYARSRPPKTLVSATGSGWREGTGLCSSQRWVHGGRHTRPPGTVIYVSDKSTVLERGDMFYFHWYPFKRSQKLGLYA